MKPLLVGTLMMLSYVLSSAQSPKWLDASLPLEERVDMILSELTLEEKVALCHAQGKFSTAGVPRLGIPELWYSDGPHGVRAEINWNDWGYSHWKNDSCTAFPALTCLAASFNPEMSYLYGQAIGQEARYRKKDVLLGPGVNIYRTPLNGRNFEYMGEDPYLASVMVVPYIRGVQENGVAACVKHYALNNQETDRGHVLVEVSDRALHEIYLPAFKASAEAGAWTFMGAYNQYNGQHCCHNEKLINQILKTDWQWDGAVVSDWGGAHSTEQSAKYGLDLEMGTYTDGLVAESKFDFCDYYLAKPYLKGLKEGRYDLATLDDKVRRILRLMLRTNLNQQRPLGSFVTEEHAQVAQRIAEEGIVLLKNDNHSLPLSQQAMRIAVIGENATRNLMEGAGSSELKPKVIVTPLQGIREAFPQAEVVYARAYDSGRAMYSSEGKPTHDLEALHREAVSLAATSDVVIFVGGLNKNHRQDCEGVDRREYALPFGQEKLINDIASVNDQLVVVLMSGNAVETSWAPKAKAIVQAWYGGSYAGHALASVLAGKVNPSGKLPFSFPVRLEDNGAMSFGQRSYPGDGVKQSYLEDVLVGYRWHDTKKIPAAYAFGYGLSYTTFGFSHFSIDKKRYSTTDEIIINLTLENTGEIEGAEVLQVYVGKNKSKVLRATKELKAFQKCRLKAGESCEVRLSVPVSSLAYYDETMQQWQIEPGDYRLYVGNSSDNILWKSTLRIE